LCRNERDSHGPSSKFEGKIKRVKIRKRVSHIHTSLKDIDKDISGDRRDTTGIHTRKLTDNKKRMGKEGAGGRTPAAPPRAAAKNDGGKGLLTEPLPPLCRNPALLLLGGGGADLWVGAEMGKYFPLALLTSSYTSSLSGVSLPLPQESGTKTKLVRWSAV